MYASVTDGRRRSSSRTNQQKETQIFGVEKADGAITITT